jgi:protein-S-isoprenylcysteine O-methyltransferase Ste14
MKPLPYILPYALVFWSIFVWAFGAEFNIVRRRQRPAGQADSPDAGSYHVIVFGMGIAFAAAFPLASMPVLQIHGNWRLVSFLGGLACLVGGSLLRRHCWRMLGASFTGDVQVCPDQPIVTSGAYAGLRHPSYTGAVLMYASIGLSLGSWVSLAVLSLTSLAVFSYRIAVEERALLKVIGEPYSEFIRTRKRLIPYLY